MSIASLALLDVNRIKDFIFAAPYLREIRGSSRLLAQFNDPDQVKKSLDQKHGKLLYAGGGSVLARFPSKYDADEFIRAEHQRLEAKTRGGATLTGISCEIGADDFGLAVLNAQAQLRFAKSSRSLPTRHPISFLLKPCQSCGERPSQEYNETKKRHVCIVCDLRIAEGGLVEARELYSRFREGFPTEAKSKWQSAHNPADLESLAATSKNYIGLIRADGNALGNRIKHLAEIGDEGLFGAFSEKCRQVTEDSILMALRKAYPEPRRTRGPGMIFPFEFVLLGGDDLQLIVTGDKAIHIANVFCEEFTLRMRDFAIEARRPNLAVSMSAGVVFAQSSYPISSLDRLGEQLLRSAKARSRRDSPVSILPTVDFMVVTSSLIGDLASIRRQYVKQRHCFTRRPYSLPELNLLTTAITKMKYTNAPAKPFPHNKLQTLRDLFFPFQGPRSARLDYDVLQLRLSDEHREMLKLAASLEAECDGPWRDVEDPSLGYDCDTSLADVVELYEFV